MARSLVIDVAAGVVSVDGWAESGLDLSTLPAGARRLVWDGEHGEIDINGTPQPLADLAGLGPLFVAHAARRRQKHPPRPGAWTVEDAVGRVLELIVAESQRRQHALIEVEGTLYYADAWATATVEVAQAAAQALGLADTDPVRVPPPLQPGWWLSASLDASGNRVAVPMTVGGLKALVVALYDRNGLIWGAEMVHKATLEAMAAGGATAADILAYDHLQGWPE